MLQDSVGKNSWLQTQFTHYDGITALVKAFPLHYEAWTGGHVAADKVWEERRKAGGLACSVYWLVLLTC
jgi:hypothetical protein